MSFEGNDLPNSREEGEVAAAAPFEIVPLQDVPHDVLAEIDGRVEREGAKFGCGGHDDLQESEVRPAANRQLEGREARERRRARLCRRRRTHSVHAFQVARVDLRWDIPFRSGLETNCYVRI